MKINWGVVISAAAIVITLIGSIIVFSNRFAVVEAKTERIDATTAQTRADVQGLKIGQEVIKFHLGISSDG